MKRITLVIPVSLAEGSAQWLFENNVRVLLSYSKDEFFDSKVIIVCAVPDEALTAFQTQFKTTIKP